MDTHSFQTDIYLECGGVVPVDVLYTVDKESTYNPFSLEITRVFREFTTESVDLDENQYEALAQEALLDYDWKRFKKEYRPRDENDHTDTF